MRLIEYPISATFEDALQLLGIIPSSVEVGQFETVRVTKDALAEFILATSPAGKDGREVLLRNDGTYVQWKYDTDAAWQNLIALTELTGPEGPQGGAATIAVGVVTTGAPGSNATVNNSGTSSDAVFDFLIPRGDKGEKGDVGAQGIPGPKGDTGDQGAQGVQGAPGTPGTAATVTVGGTSTGAPGTSATVQNTGTANAAVLQFTIPRGDVGPTGADGAAGAKGDKGWAPVIALVIDDPRVVMRVIDWVGGEGAKPTSGLYIGLTGLVPNIADAVNVKGAQGIQGPKGDTGDTGPAGPSVWGGITGSIADQSDLKTQLDGKTPLPVGAGATDLMIFRNGAWQEIGSAFGNATAKTALTGLDRLLIASQADAYHARYCTMPSLFTSAADQNLVRRKRSVGPTYYVRTDGNDSNSGTSNTAGGAFATIQKAIDVVSEQDLGLFNATINVGAGVFAPATFKNIISSGGVGRIVGTGTGTVIRATTVGTYCLGNPNNAGHSGIWQVNNLRLDAPGATSCLGIDCAYGFDAQVVFGGVDFGVFPDGGHMRVGRGAIISNANQNYSISGSANFHLSASDSGQIRVQNALVTITESVAFSTYADCTRAGSILGNGLSYSGSATGKRYNANYNAIILTFMGPNGFPGDVAGTTSFGGLYI